MSALCLLRGLPGQLSGPRSSHFYVRGCSLAVRFGLMTSTSPGGERRNRNIGRWRPTCVRPNAMKQPPELTTAQPVFTSTRAPVIEMMHHIKLLLLIIVVLLLLIEMLPNMIAAWRPKPSSSAACLVSRETRQAHGSPLPCSSPQVEASHFLSHTAGLKSPLPVVGCQYRRPEDLQIHAHHRRRGRLHPFDHDAVKLLFGPIAFRYESPDQ